MSTTITSTADVATDRAARYGKQLTSHLGRRSIAVWDDDAAAGTIQLASGFVRLSCTPTHLHLDLVTEPDDADQAEDVVGRHLVRFGTRDELVVSWDRSDGTPGTEQRLPAQD